MMITQTWQVKAVQEAVKKADTKNAKFISHDEVLNWLNSWGAEEEREAPIPRRYYCSKYFTLSF